jgi:hypothetical protein
MISNVELQRSMPLISIALLACLCDLPVILDVMDRRFGLINEIGTKDSLFSRLNLVEQCATSTSVQNFKWCHLETLLVEIVVRELSPWQILVPITLVFHHTCS